MFSNTANNYSNVFPCVQTLKDEDTKKDYDYMLDHPGILFMLTMKLNVSTRVVKTARFF